MFELFVYAAAIVVVLLMFGESENHRYAHPSQFEDLSNQPEPVGKPEPEIDVDPHVITSLTELWQPPSSTDAIVEAEAIARTDEIAIRSHCTETSDLAQQPKSTDTVVPFRRSLKRLGIRKLRLMARDRGLRSYSQFTKQQLLEYLQA